MNHNTIHASAVVFGQNAALILGKSGAGKSRLMLELMARGCQMLGDDLVTLETRGDEIWVKPNRNADGRFEIRDAGIFQTQPAEEAKLAFVVDLDQASDERLPEMQQFTLRDRNVYRLCAKSFPNLDAFVYLWLKEEIWPWKGKESVD